MNYDELQIILLVFFQESKASPGNYIKQGSRLRLDKFRCLRIGNAEQIFLPEYIRNSSRVQYLDASRYSRSMNQDVPYRVCWVEDNYHLRTRMEALNISDPKTLIAVLNTRRLE